MIPKSTVVNHKQIKNKVLLKINLITFLSIEQGISVQNLKYIASIQLEQGNAKELCTLFIFPEYITFKMPDKG